MVNASLAYEILMYINSFYFGLFATCELGTLVLKSAVITTLYEVEKDPTKIGQDYGVLFGLFVVEATRLVLGRRGSLSEKDDVLYISMMSQNLLIVIMNVPVIISVVLTVPSILGVLYLLIWQVVVLRIEYIWCTLMLTIQVLELVFASMFVVTSCKGPSYA